MATVRFARGWLVASSVGAALCGLGCNGIFGIDAGHLIPTDSGAGGSTSSTGGSSGSSSSGGHDGGLGGSGGDAGGASGSGGTGGGTGGVSPVDGGKDGGSAGAGTDLDHVRCGLRTCDTTAGDVCCRTTTTGGNPHCAASCDGSTETTFLCDGAEDCGAGQACCLGLGESQAKCNAACAPNSRVFCTKNSDCGTGNWCTAGAGPLFKFFGVCAPIPKVDRVWCGGEPCDVESGKVCCFQKGAKTESCVLASSCVGVNTVPIACDGPDDCLGSNADGAAPMACCSQKNGINLFTGEKCATSCTTPVQCTADNDCAGGLQCCITGNFTTTCQAACPGEKACRTQSDCDPGKTCTFVKDPSGNRRVGTLVCL